MGGAPDAALAMDQGDSNRKYWPVLQVEIGVTSPNPSLPDDFYYRVVPYGSAGALPSTRFPGYFYQESPLPGNETYTVMLDKASYGKDYELATGTFGERILASEQGHLYYYDYSGGASWKTAAPTGLPSRAFTSGFYWDYYADHLYLAEKCDASDDPLFSQSSSLSPSGAWSTYASPQGVNVWDQGMVSFMNGQQHFLLLATDKGPRGADTANSPNPNLTGLEAVWHRRDREQALLHLRPGHPLQAGERLHGLEG